VKVITYRASILFPLTWDPSRLAEIRDKTLVNQKGKTVSVFRHEEFTAEEMRAGIGGLLGGDAGIATVYSFDRREVLELPKTGQAVRFLPRSGESVSLTPGKVQLVLFDSGVCLLSVDVALENEALEDVMNTAYYLCEIKDAANRFSWERVTFDPATKTKTAAAVEFSVRELLLRCAAFIPGCGHFEDRPLESAVAKPLLYSYLLLEHAPEDPGTLASNVGQNYKLTYKGVDSSPMLYTFRNSFWCASANGAANISYLVDDPGTNEFFRTSYPHKWDTEYRFLMLNTVHQKYAVLKCLDTMALNAADPGDYAQMKQYLSCSEALQEFCGDLKLRCFFTLPSRIDHVNKTYAFLQECLQIPAYVDGLNRQLQETVSVCRSYTGRFSRVGELEKQARAAMTEIKLALLAAAITCLTFFDSFYATLCSLLSGDFSGIRLDTVIMTITFVATIATAIVNLAKKHEEVKGLRGEIAALKQKTGLHARKEN